jgi:Tfp pilus assembly protein FimT
MKCFEYQRARCRRGVSIIEVTVVVLLVSATASAAVFRMSSAPVEDPARIAAQSLITAIRDARTLAIEHQSPITISLDPNSKPARWVFNASPGVKGNASRWEVALDDATQVEGTQVPIRLDRSGNASYLGNWKIRSASGYQVTLEPIGARAMMKSLN